MRAVALHGDAPLPPPCLCSESSLPFRKKAGKDPNAAITIGGGQRLEDYVKDFRWADDKYPVHTPLREMTDEIVQKVTNYANQLALKMTAYQKLTTELGGLNTRSGCAAAAAATAAAQQPTGCRDPFFEKPTVLGCAFLYGPRFLIISRWNAGAR
eukprot:SAG11_NODE_1722_length_4374_cov_5.082807_1_plen_155_part_00